MAEGPDGSAVEAEAAIVKEEDESIELLIERAMSSRVQYFHEQSDSLTFEGVRRLLEKDLGLEEYALDVHKRFIKQHLSECLNGADDGNVSESSAEIVEQGISSIKAEVESPEKHQTKKDAKEPNAGGEDNMEDSPVMGLLTGNKSTKSEVVETQCLEKKESPTEAAIKKAIQKRASYLKANSQSITMAGVRRLLEEDLELDKNTLDPFKKFISAEVEWVLKSFEVPESATSVEKQNFATQSKALKKISRKRSSDSLDRENDDVHDEVKSKKKISSKEKHLKSEGFRKRKRTTKETKVLAKKPNKIADTMSEENSNTDDCGNVSEDSQPQSSAEKTVMKKELSTPAYGKQVEHLKSIIKSCGMSVAPSVYKRAKQVPEHKREAFLIKELEGILSREGLSSNPTEKEIKEVKKRKERAKELEGIDMSNIVSSTRRRSTTSYVAPPKPKIPVKNDEDNAEDTNNEDDEDSHDEDDDDRDDEDDSQGEEVNEDDDDDSD